MSRGSIPVYEVTVQSEDVPLPGFLAVPDEAEGIVLFAHGSGSSRFSPRNQYVADVLNEAGLATLLFDLLTPEEHRIDEVTRHLRFDIGLLAARLKGTIDWVGERTELRRQPVGLFGASTGAAAALIAAADRPERVAAVVSRGGRPDLADEALPRVHAPVMLIVGGEDLTVLELNRRAAQMMRRARNRIEVIAGATHLFEEPGTLEEAAARARDWFVRHLAADP